jgi:ribosomal subunit interface protein
MQLEPEISYRDLGPSPAIEAKVKQRIERLERHFANIMGCRVMLEAHHRHQHKGKLYHVRIDVTVPGQELVVSRDPKDRRANEDLYVAIRDAFDAMERQLQSFAEHRRHEVKAHPLPPHGRIALLADDHGRIETVEGRSIYFHRNSVLDDGFDDLQVGLEVRFIEAMGDDGPQASTVTPLSSLTP